MGGAGGHDVWASVGYRDDPSGVNVNFSGKALNHVVLDVKTYSVAASSARDARGATDTSILGGRNISISVSGAADDIRSRDGTDIDRIEKYMFGDSGNGRDEVGYRHAGEDAGDHGVVVNLCAVRSGSFAGTARTVAAGVVYDPTGKPTGASAMKP